jgi:hypothetical protein
MEFQANPATLEVKKSGEVYTPLFLVTEMLDKLPSHVWSNPSLIWFEPACGLAPFLYMAYYRLFEGLKEIIPNDEVRRTHILETMFYFNEIQTKNIELFKLLFNASAYKLNVFEGSFFEVVPASFQADIIIGNPPYNAPGTSATGHTIWPQFVRSILTKNTLKHGGYLSFVHPSLWRKPGSDRSKTNDLFKLMTQTHQLLHLEMYDSKAGGKTFGCGTKYDWYVIENRPCYNTTSVKCEKGGLTELDLKSWDWLPNTLFSEVAKLIAPPDTPTQKVVAFRNRYFSGKKDILSLVKTEEFCHPIVHTTPKVGIRYFYSNQREAEVFDIPKVIFGDSGINHTVVDVGGGYGMTEHAIALVIESKEEGETLSGVLKSHAFTKLLKACTWSNFQLDWRLFAGFKEKFWELVDVEAVGVVSPVSGCSDGGEEDNDGKCQSLTQKGTRCSKKAVENGCCKIHMGKVKVKSPVVASSSAPVKLADASSSSSAELDRVKLSQSSGSKGYTIAQLTSYCKERGLKIKSKSSKDVIRELLQSGL